MFIAHKMENSNERQMLIDHLKQTAIKAKSFGNKFGAGEHAYIAGLLHDLGKYSQEFQDRINGSKKWVDHSTAGAQEVFKRFEGKNLGPVGKLIAYCIGGHHGGLPDAGASTDTNLKCTLSSKLNNDKIYPYESYRDEVPDINLSANLIPQINPTNGIGFALAFYIRMLYSCLVDADFLDTEAFMRENEVARGYDIQLDDLLVDLNKKIQSFGEASSPINDKRTEILNACINKAKHPKGIFSLTVPTGGGKTFSSMAFALNHAKKHGMDRIIYVIPYTSIIEQNAAEFRNVFGENIVLEHHSNFDFNDDEEEKYNKLKLSSENWDIPIIVTTNVQFFESLFANKSSRCRKLHNIINSVIIFDEAQMLPLSYLIPCVKTISELVANYNCSAVLCTATQPALDNLLPEEMEVKEICEDTTGLYNFFKRTKIIKRGLIENETLIKEINSQRQVLCIVNMRKHTLDLFSMLEGDDVFHLSTYMCPFDRRAVISKIKNRLKNDLPCKVISTSLIEAGVDIDFPIVYRTMTGLDSIIQSAGRCNREGKLKDDKGKNILGEVHVFNPEDKYTKWQPKEFKITSELTKGIMRRFDDIASLDAIRSYFEEMQYILKAQGLDTSDICKNIEENHGTLDFDFKDIASKFKIIDDNTYPIIIPSRGNASELINKLAEEDFHSKTLRSLQAYTVNVYEKEYNNLLSAGKIRFVASEFAVLADEDSYNERTGIKLELESGIGIYA